VDTRYFSSPFRGSRRITPWMEGLYGDSPEGWAMESDPAAMLIFPKPLEAFDYPKPRHWKGELVGEAMESPVGIFPSARINPVCR